MTVQDQDGQNINIVLFILEDEVYVNLLYVYKNVHSLNTYICVQALKKMPL